MYLNVAYMSVFLSLSFNDFMYFQAVTCQRQISLRTNKVTLNLATQQ